MIEQLLNTSKKAADLLARLMRIVCVGEVIAVEGAGQRVKVRLPNHDNMASDWLRVLARRSLGVRTSCNLKVGEQVLCLFPPLGDMRSGYVLGALYNQKDAPFQDNPDVFGAEFEDGARMTYDQVSHTLNVSLPGGVPVFEMTPDGIRFKGDIVADDGMTIGKSLVVAESVTAQSINDGSGSMSTMRSQYNAHAHTNDGTSPPTVPMGTTNRAMSAKRAYRAVRSRRMR